MPKHIVVVGATGEIGQAITRRLLERGERVTIVSRDPQAAQRLLPGATAYQRWQMDEVAPWQAILQGADVIMNFASAPVFAQKWTPAYREQLNTIHIQGTNIIVRAMQTIDRPPAVFINASAVGIYGYSKASNEPFNEQAVPDDDAFTNECFLWEKAAFAAEAFGVRVVLLRTSFVLDYQLGGLPPMAQATRNYVGGPILGAHWTPWIHIKDVQGLIEFAMDNQNVRGGLNLCAPDVVSQRDFQATLSRVLHRPALFAKPSWLLRLFMGEAATILIHGKRVIPQKALDLGYQFRFPTLEAALYDLLSENTRLTTPREER
ncbi:TIGR01777 family oxidoreductase [Tengunoibacter tsumagoiensis]|uniref:Epimerase n=1 Tax=Tengunoibacter tsumagoiensis TaxID=2014871 RepID=A0A402AA06_9CHLR|nr:TIGR01777 family oxidoreductase [Tengunoibacter tsumagoiensis]GCE16002.1 epimerase [Tengunoibacter tsumagoiensis]